jgi:hypothetical protein
MPNVKKLDWITVHDATGEDLTEAVVAMFEIPVGEPVRVLESIGDYIAPVSEPGFNYEEEFSTKEDLGVMFDGLVDRYAKADIRYVTYEYQDGAEGWVFGGTGKTGGVDPADVELYVSYLGFDQDLGVSLWSLQSEWQLTIHVGTSDVDEPAPAEEKDDGRLYAHAIALEGDEDPREVDFLHHGGPLTGTKVAIVSVDFRAGDNDGVPDEFVAIVDWQDADIPNGTALRVVVNGDSVYEDVVADVTI